MGNDIAGASLSMDWGQSGFGLVGTVLVACCCGRGGGGGFCKASRINELS